MIKLPLSLNGRFLVGTLVMVILSLLAAWGADVNGRLGKAEKQGWEDHTQLTVLVEQSKRIDGKLDKLIEMHMEKGTGGGK